MEILVQALGEGILRWWRGIDFAAGRPRPKWPGQGQAKRGRSVKAQRERLSFITVLLER